MTLNERSYSLHVPPLYHSQLDGPRGHHHGRLAVSAGPDARRLLIVQQYVPDYSYRHWRGESRFGASTHGRPHRRPQSPGSSSCRSGPCAKRAAESLSRHRAGAINFYGEFPPAQQVNVSRPRSHQRRRAATPYNYGGFSIGHFIWHWWPLVLIFWGAVKLYERTAASRAGNAATSPITAGEIFLVLGLLLLLGIVVAVDYGKQHLPDEVWRGGLGDRFEFHLEVAPKPVPPDARITIRNGRGDISVHASDEPQIRVSGKKNAKGWNETEAHKLADRASVEIVQNGDGYEIHPAGSSDSRLSLDLEVSVPKKSLLTIRNEKGDISVSDMGTPVSINNGSGDIEVRNTAGDVSIDTHKGATKVSDTNGNVKISGRGGEVSVTSATGGLTLDGEFFGPITADKVAKGVRFISQRTDLTLTQLSGHLEAGSGNLEITDAPGNLNLRTNRYDVSVENAGG